MEGHWLKRQNYLARFVHWLNVVLEALRRERSAQLSIAVDKHCAAGVGVNRLPKNAADKAAVADIGANDTNTDDVRSRFDVAACIKPQRRVKIADRVEIKRNITDGRVVSSGGVAEKRAKADGCVGLADGVGLERLNTCGRVGDASRIAKERLITSGRVVLVGCIAGESCRTNGCVADAGCVVNERNITDCRVVSSGGVARKRTSTDGCVAVGGGIGKERLITDGRVGDTGGIAKERLITDGCVARGGIVIEGKGTDSRVGSTASV